MPHQFGRATQIAGHHGNAAPERLEYHHGLVLVPTRRQGDSDRVLDDRGERVGIEAPEEPHAAVGVARRQGLEALEVGTVAGHVQAHGLVETPDGVDQRVDALLGRQAPGIHHRTRILSRPLGRSGDEVRDPPQALREHARSGHAPGHEPARAHEHLHMPVGAQRRVDRQLGGHRRARAQRAVLAPPAHGLGEVPAQARLAELALVEEAVGRTGQLVVVQGHHGRDAAAGQRPEDRRRQVVIDVVEVNDVGSEVSDDGVHAVAGVRRPDHARKALRLGEH